MNFNMFDGLRFEQMPYSSKSNTESRFPASTPAAMAYVPFQQWGEPYEISVGFTAGTVFPELDLPFEPNGGYTDERKG